MSRHTFALTSRAGASRTAARTLPLLLMAACGGSQTTPEHADDGPQTEPGGVQVGTASPSRAGANKDTEHTAEYEPLFYTRRVDGKPPVEPQQTRHDDPVPIAMERFEAPVCEGIPARSRRACPLLSGIAEVEPTEDAFLVRFESWVDVDKAVKLMRCHHAFGQSRGWQQMPFCPLYIPGLEMEILDETAVRFTVEGDEQRKELGRRLRSHAPDATGH